MNICFGYGLVMYFGVFHPLQARLSFVLFFILRCYQSLQMKQQYYNVDNVIGDLTDNRERKKGDRERDGEEQANYSHRPKKKNIVEGGVNGQQT